MRQDSALACKGSVCHLTEKEINKKFITVCQHQADLYTWHGGGAEVTRADDVITDAVGLLEETELSNFAVTVCDVVQTCSQSCHIYYRLTLTSKDHLDILGQQG